jgi:hypothetical protein
MPNFAVRNATPPKFEGDFTIEVDHAHAATDRETAYLEKLNDVLATVADDLRQDLANPLQPRLAEARRGHSRASAAQLRLIAEEFANGKIDPDTALRATNDAGQVYARDRPDFAARDKSPKEKRFEGDFAVVQTNYQPDLAETAYIGRIDYVQDALAHDETADKAANYPVARLAARQECRKNAAGRIRDEFESYRGNNISSEIASDNVLVVHGIYIADRNRLERPLFDVDFKTGVAGGPDATFAVDLDIRLTPGLPPPEDQPSQEKQDLFVDIGSTFTVISTICQHMRDRADKRWREPKGREEKELARRLLDQYVRKLTGIARVGLQGPHTALAKLALNELRAEFTAQQAGRVKNTYVRSLGVTAALFTALLLVAYAIVDNSQGMDWWYKHKAFLLAAAGASVGTWLSFSIRRVSLSFNDLAILEEDLLDPSVRIIFVIGLTLTACLLFWTGVMNIQIGDLKTNATDFANKGSIATLVGVFLGISERALATAISGRAAAFVRGIGSG